MFVGPFGHEGHLVWLIVHGFVNMQGFVDYADFDFVVRLSQRGSSSLATGLAPAPATYTTPVAGSPGGHGG